MAERMGGGQGGTLGGAIGQSLCLPGKVIKRNDNGPIRQKGQQPVTQLGREPQNTEKVDSTVPTNVVKETLDVKEEGRNRRASMNALLCHMH